MLYFFCLFTFHTLFITLWSHWINFPQCDYNHEQNK